MKKLVAISDGHEMNTAGKRTPPIQEINGYQIRENEFNKAVAILLEQELLRCGINVINVSNTDDDSLEKRVERANKAKADIYISIHYNAFDGIFNENDPEGMEIHIVKKGGEAEKLANYILDELKQGTQQNNRGIKVSNFYELRETTMPAILSENGFMDNKREALLMINKAFQKEVAREHARGICKYFNIPYVSLNDVEVNANQLEYYRQKFIDLKDFIDEVLNFGGN